MDAAVNRDMGIGKINRRALPEVAQRLTLKTSRRLWPEARRIAFIIPLAFFDVDGVLLAWREALDGFADPAGFTSEMYEEQVAGKPRLAGRGGGGLGLAYGGRFVGRRKRKKQCSLCCLGARSAAGHGRISFWERAKFV